MKSDVEARMVGPNGSHLLVSCEPEAFHRLLDMICREANFIDPIGAVHSVNICVELPEQRQSRWGDRLALAGCALVATVLIVIFAAGVAALAGLFTH
jgi:hypothetical protein